MSSTDYHGLEDGLQEEAKQIKDLEAVEEMNLQLPAADSAEDFSAKVNNGAGYIKFLAIFMCLVTSTITALMWGTVGLKGADETDISDRISPSLTVMASLQTIACLLSIWDLVLIFTRYPPSTELVKFETQQDAFKRMSIPFSLTILLFFPTMGTFSLHSLGFEFWELMSGETRDIMDSGIHSCIIFMITSFCCAMVVGLIHAGYAEWMMRTVFWVTPSMFHLKPRKAFRINIARRTLALLTFAAGGMFYGAQIWTLALVPDNSGVVTSFILFSLVVIPYFWICSVRLLVMRFDMIGQIQVQRCRNVALLTTTVCYLVFWVNLLLLLLEGVWSQSWWETVAGTVAQDVGLCALGYPACHLNTTRSTVVFFQFGLTILLIALYGARVFLHKIRKKWTLPREEFPEAVVQRREEIAAERLGVEAVIVATHQEDPEDLGVGQDDGKDHSNDDVEEEKSIDPAEDEAKSEKSNKESKSKKNKTKKDEEKIETE